MTPDLVLTIFIAGIAAGTTLVFAAVGEIITERSGVLNLGVEGMMLVGAVTGFLVNNQIGQPWIGAIAGVLAGAAMGLVHAVFVVGFKTNQVVTGLALVIFGNGLSGYLGTSVVGEPPPATFDPIALPLLSSIPVLGRILFNQDALVYAGYILVAGAWWFVFRTRPGLNLRSVGESPETADAVGISVVKTRYLAVMCGGGFAGLGGAYLSLAQAPSWVPNLTAGRGWIAIALVIFATWNPLRAALGGYLFGCVEALSFRLQAVGVDIPVFFVSMLPYLFTIAVLVVISRGNLTRRLAAPAALGNSFAREER
ncbi:MAG: ABC transporter permease [Actinobacteria bacterium]|nr:ABC transporter permease [Actinomycetota bacterium]